MAVSDKLEIEQQLALLRKEFADKLGQRIDQMIADLKTLGDQADPFAKLQVIFRQIHSLSGSAGTFGFQQVSELSRQMELILKETINQQRLPDTKMAQYLNAQLQKFYGLIAHGADFTDASEPEPESHNRHKDTNETVFILSEEAELAQTLCQPLKQYGFIAQAFNSIAEFTSAIKANRPDALVVDISPGGKVYTEQRLACGFQPSDKHPIPSLFMSSHNDWNTRLAAVKSASVAYLDKPVEISQLVDCLDQFTQHKPRDPYRVLVVDDAMELAQHYGLVLRQAGMHTEVINQSAETLQTLALFKPELILLDVYLPGITGMEIAKVIRQHPDYFYIPIIFLSTELDRDIQLKALQQGDDFLEKPILDKRLVTAVKSRIDRARKLNRYMYLDNLTGLLNRISLQHQLDIEQARSQQHNTPLCYAKLSLDGLQKISDRYGPWLGNQMLNALADQLKTQLDKCHQAGHWGGGEFGIILANTSAQRGHQIIERLAGDFAQLTFPCESKQIQGSVSTGIACTMEFNSTQALLDAADQALHQSQHRAQQRAHD